LVLDVELLAQALGELLRNEPRDQVARTAGGERDDDAHLPDGVRLRGRILCVANRDSEHRRCADDKADQNRHLMAPPWGPSVGMIDRRIGGTVSPPPNRSFTPTGSMLHNFLGRACEAEARERTCR
jgi:hypothetical protein